MIRSTCRHTCVGIFVRIVIVFVFFCSLPVAPGWAQEAVVDAWPQWRGPLGTGEAVGATPPLDWSETKHVKWKTPIPGRGHSTPIVWGRHVFVLAAVPVGERLPPKMSGRPGEHDNLAVDSRFEFVVLAIDRESGTPLWKKTVRQALPIEGGHRSASLASASPVTDGQHVYAFFGSHGLDCLDFDGKLIWEKDFGMMHSKHGHGEGSSPALYEDKLIVNWDHEGQSCIAALNKTTGEPLWKRERNEDTSWSSPIVDEALCFLTHDQNILTRPHGPTGEESPGAMRLGPLGDIYASPAAANGYVFVTDREGNTLVIKDGEIPRQFSLNPVGEEVNASLAIVGNQVFVRGTEHLFCIEEASEGEQP